VATINLPFSGGNNDCYGSADGTSYWQTNSDQLESWANDAAGIATRYGAGLRFQVPISQGIIISAANLSLQNGATQNTPLCHIYADASDDSADFASAVGTITNGTGIVTGSPLTLNTGVNTPTITQAGTFIVNLPSYATGTAASGGWTVTLSPVTLAAGNTTIIVQAGGAGTITITVHNLWNRTFTTANVAYSNAGLPSGINNTLDFTPVVQEIISRPAWVYNNHLTLALLGNNHFDSPQQQFQFASGYFGSGAFPVLNITYGVTDFFAVPLGWPH
jgi:hypothetical protein